MKCCKILFFSFCLFVYVQAFSQTIFTGQIKNTANRAITNASILLSTPSTNSILAYGISDNAGNFKITLHTKSDTIKITISCIDYLTLEKNVVNISQTSIFTLTEKSTELPTVVVKNSPIILQGDTTNYSASFFSSKQDRVIGDVLAKLPGIEIDANGTITYNGKPISNYYIDGLDLLGTKYNIANQNIPSELVDKIQLLNNHQAIRALDSFATTKGTAINIKLKAKAKNRVITKAKLGIGVTPILWDNELTPLNFRKNLQLIGAYKNNNSGSYLYSELNDNYAIKQLGAEDDNTLNVKLLNLVSLPAINLPAKRYTFNNSHLVHFNILTVLKNKAQLKLNVSQYFDNNTSIGSNSITFFLPNDTINFKEVYNNNNKENKFKTELNYTINTQKYYLRNLLTYKNEQSAETGNIETIQSVLQKLSSNSNTVSNEFTFNKVKRKVLLSFSSKLNYTANPQELAVLPGTFATVFNGGANFPELKQKTNLKNLLTNTSISLTRKKKALQYESKLGIETSNIYLQSYFLNPLNNSIALTADSLTNKLTWQRIKPYIFNTLSFIKKKNTFALTIPIEANFATQKDNNTGQKKTYTNVSLNPRLDITIPLTSKLEMQIGFVKQTTIKSILDTHDGYILTNYRTLRQNDSILPVEKLKNLKGSFAYKNPLNGLFIYFTTSYSALKRNLLLSNTYNNSLTKTLAIQRWNNQYSLYFTGYINKFFLTAKTNVSIVFVRGEIKNLQLLQNTETQISSTINEIKIKTTVNKFSWGNFENSLSLQKNKSKLFQMRNEISDIQNFSIQNNFKIYFFLTSKFSTSVNTDYYDFKNTQAVHSKYFFLDWGLRYKFRNIDIEATITNITNNKVFNAALLTKNTSQEYDYKIRPANALVRFYFSF